MGHKMKKHYVYLYQSPEDGAPIYVGKGWGDRAWSHVEIAARNPEQHRNKYFARTLAKWLREGHKIEPQIVQVFETHEAALQLEIELIRKYGRHNIKTGTLLNLTDGGEGTAGRGLQIEVDGVNYPTIREACLKYGQDEAALRNRINVHGYTVGQAFGIEPPPAYPPSGAKAITVAGIEFPTISAACDHFGLARDIVSARLNRTDWTHEQIFGLAPPPVRLGPNAIPITVGDCEFPSLREACRILIPHLNEGTIKNRVGRKGWTIEQAFELDPPPGNKGGPRNHVTAFGAEYQSISEATRAHGIGYSTVLWRMKHGRTLEQALTEKAESTYSVGPTEFKNFTVACEHFGQSRQAVLWRLKEGWSVENAFKIAPRKAKMQ